MDNLTIAIVASGAMGAGVGARLTERGAKVLTSLDGRSDASAARAQAAGMMPAPDGELVRADFFLSIVPPNEALALAERFAPALQSTAQKPTYVDCNAVSPQTVRSVAAVVEDTGCAFADAGIIGAPPKAGSAGPRFYVSGRESSRVAALTQYGLSVQVMDGGIGDASALKLCYASLTKGFTALGSASALAAERAGISAALRAELAASQPHMLAYIERAMPGMFDKAYRFVGEMEEIAKFFENDAEHRTYEGIAAQYRRLAQDHAGDGQEISSLRRFVGPPPGKSA